MNHRLLFCRKLQPNHEDAWWLNGTCRKAGCLAVIPAKLKEMRNEGQIATPDRMKSGGPRDIHAGPESVLHKGFSLFDTKDFGSACG